MKTLITLLIIAASLTSCVKASEFSTIHPETINVKQGKPVTQEYININDTLYTSPEAYVLTHGGNLDSKTIN